MKTLKLNMVLAMITFTIAGLTSAAKTSAYLKERLYLTFDNAMKCNDLVLALYQLYQPCLPRRHQNSYLAAVILEDIQYVIMGSYEQWKDFYTTKWEYLEKNCPSVICAN